MRPKQEKIKLVGGGWRMRHPRNENSGGGAMSAERAAQRKAKEARRKNRGAPRSGD